MKKLLLTAGAAVLALSTAASAASFFTIDGGTAGSIPASPGSSAVVNNNVLDQLTGVTGSTLAGTFGASIGEVNTSNSYKVDIIGYEALELNTFTLDGGSYTTAAAAFPGEFSATGLASWIATNLDFTFSTTSGATPSSVSNGDANDFSSGTANFFAAIDTDGSLLLFFDDFGNADDDNHDDLVVRISAVPLPAGMLLLMTGMGALVVRSRRKA